MKLADLDVFKHIIIQCHDNPDADAIASGFALYQYFKKKGKNVFLIYSGKFYIQKCNLELMIDKLCIPIRHVETMDILKSHSAVLLTVDCQYGEGNVTNLAAHNIAVIDHHQDTGKNIPFSEIRSNIGSCSTLVWAMLTETGYDVNKDKAVSTALYYGLFMDTSGLEEFMHPLDKDMKEALYPDKLFINKLKHTNLSLQELETTGIALIRHLCDEKNRFVLVKAHPCDPNILGIISDLLLQVNIVEVCVVYNDLPFGYKLSVRSCLPEASAHEVIEFITAGIGTGGGHREKAGGFINKDKFVLEYPDMGIDAYIMEKQREYFKSYDVIESANYQIDPTEYKKVIKKNVQLGYVKTTDLMDQNIPVRIRTLQGDVDINISDDIYIIIGENSEIHPITKERFEALYEVFDTDYKIEPEYPPKVINRIDGSVTYLLDFARTCISNQSGVTLVKKLDKPTKVFSSWNYDGYMYGKAGDYLAVKEDDKSDIYIIDEKVFHRLYEALKSTALSNRTEPANINVPSDINNKLL